MMEKNKYVFVNDETNIQYDTLSENTLIIATYYSKISDKLVRISLSDNPAVIADFDYHDFNIPGVVGGHKLKPQLEKKFKREKILDKEVI